MKNGVFWDVTPRHVALVRADVSDELNASFLRVTRIGGVGTTVALNSKRCMLQRKRRFLQGPQGIISQKTAFFK
jgi:hypothetical protein